MSNPRSAIAALQAARRAREPAGMIAAIPYAAWLGLAGEPEADGGLVLRLPFRADLVGNPHLPALHGGVVGGFLEVSAALTLLWQAESVELPRVVNLSVDYLRPCLERETRAKGVVTKLGRRVANVAVEAWQDDPDRPVAQAQAHLLVSSG